MKKIFTLLFVALCAISASAITVTFNGKTIENGGTVVVGPEAFKLVQKGPFTAMEAESDIYVSGSTHLSLYATSATTDIKICEISSTGAAGQCYDWMGTTSPYTLTINSLADAFKIDLSFNRVSEVPKVTHSVDITINSNEAPFNFKFVYDCTAGISGVGNDFNGVYTVYSIVGIKVLETTDKDEIRNLPAGLYIVNGEKVIVR